ncbi:MAG: hypothetical protein HQL96_12210 [Magnetococcales bacterium]|nr:hypothetical protein [Magnetococcales bacterium]
MQPVDSDPNRFSFRAVVGGLALLLAVSGCSDEASDPVVLNLVARDTTVEKLERVFRPSSYWGRKVAELEKSVEQARGRFQERNQAYRESLLERRVSVTQATREARKSGGDPASARNEAVNALRSDLAKVRDEAKDAGRELRVRLAMLRRAQDLLEKAK